jgi:hypothetical protein
VLKFKMTCVGWGVATLLSFGAPAQAATMPIFTEGLEGTVAQLTAAGWFRKNNSSPVGPDVWNKGNTNDFTAQAGTAGSFAEVTYLSTIDNGAANTISNWFLTPTLTIGNGYTISFYTLSDQTAPDRLQIRLSTNGSSTNVGTTATSLGDFTTLLLDINPSFAASGYPSTWTQYTATVTGLSGSTTGRFAFRYEIDDSSVNGSAIGLDSIVVTAVPEPDTTLMLAFGLTVMGWSLRRKARG